LLAREVEESIEQLYSFAFERFESGGGSDGWRTSYNSRINPRKQDDSTWMGEPEASPLRNGGGMFHRTFFWLKLYPVFLKVP